MKETIYIILILFICTTIKAQDSSYYWYRGEKKFLIPVENKQYITFEGSISESEAIALLPEFSISEIQDIGLQSYPDSLNSLKYSASTWAILESNDNNRINNISSSNIEYAAPFFTNTNGDEIGLSELFYVKLKSENDLPKLIKIAREKKVKILFHNEYRPLWYILECTKTSDGNSLDQANYFYETNLFNATVPGFMYKIVSQSANDDYYTDQWGLNNTGQYSTTNTEDINAPGGWDITEGDNGIVIAVLDQGIQRDHDDLGNFSSYSYDTDSNTSPSSRESYHGTAIAGIIGAIKDNDEGIAGIAPNVTLMDISHSFAINTSNKGFELGRGIDRAVDNGADIINCSWSVSTADDYYIEDAIDEAVSNGRNGLGTIVVCGTGNWGNPIRFPANYGANVIAVGAMSPCGERVSNTSCDTETWESAYGSELDFIAPGTLIPTTDLEGSSGINDNMSIHPDEDGTLVSSDYSVEDYTIWFNGTSAAAPHVAAVAGLVLSANNSLTYTEVLEILASTAQKVGGYGYAVSTGDLVYSWHQEVGYGLVDAGEAVNEAVCANLIESTTYTSDITIDGCTSVDMEDISVEDDAILTIENVGSITIDGPFETEVGTQLVFDP